MKSYPVPNFIPFTVVLNLLHTKNSCDENQKFHLSASSAMERTPCNFLLLTENLRTRVEAFVLVWIWATHCRGYNFKLQQRGFFKHQRLLQTPYAYPNTSKNPLQSATSISAMAFHASPSPSPSSSTLPKEPKYDNYLYQHPDHSGRHLPSLFSWTILLGTLLFLLLVAVVALFITRRARAMPVPPPAVELPPVMPPQFELPLEELSAVPSSSSSETGVFDEQAESSGSGILV